MLRVFRAAFAAAWLAAALHAAVCVPLRDGETRKAVAAVKDPACFVVEVTAGEATQLIAEQPEDLAIDLASGETRLVADSFQFGPETATILTPGRYRVEVRPVESVISSVSFTMSRKPLALHDAAIWRDAENLATNAKNTGHSADIADSLERWEAMGNRSAVARTYLEEGDAAIGQGNFSSARAAYEKALDLCRSLSDFRCAAEAANNSGFAAQQSGDFGPAMDRLTEAADDWRKIQEKKLEGLTLSNMGLLYWYTNDFERAISLYDQARDILRSRDSLANARVMNNLGLCYQSLGEYATARSYFEQAIAVESARQDGARDAVHARLNLGRNRMLEGKTATARQILERAIKDASSLAYRPALGDALNALGQNCLARHEAKAAQAPLEQALLLHRAVGDKRSEASDLHCLGAAALERGERDTARSFLTQAIDIRRQCALREKITESLSLLAVLDRDAGDPQGARDLAEQALGILEAVRGQVPGPELRASYYARKRQFFDLLVDIEMAPHGAASAERGLLAAERGRARALLDMLAEGSILHQIPPGLVARRTAIQRQIDLISYRLSSGAANEGPRLRAQIESLVADGEAVDARIRESSSGRKLGTSIASGSQLRDLLPHDCTLIEYYLAEPGSYLWLVSPDDVRLFRLPSRSEIEAQAGLVIGLFGRLPDRERSPELEARFDSAVRRLSATLLGPLGGSPLSGRVIIVPDGILNQAPFAALELPRGEGRLGLVRDLIQVPAASFLAAGRTPRQVSDFPQALVGIADPVFSSDDPRIPAGARRPSASHGMDLARLPFTEELQRVIEMVPASRVKILRGLDANVDAVRSLRMEDYAIVHFSTHALIDDRIPELSRIALSMVTREGRPVDGFLHPYHLAALNLNGSTVVLSACGTALGKQVIGEGLAGVTASLFQAGAAQLVLSLSEVDAEASAAFFSHVYERYFGPHPTNMEHALTLARQALAHSKRWVDPYYWASFIVVGRP